MNKAILFDFRVDKPNKKILVERSFNAPVALVWAAWTEADLLDLWWAPKPWRAETKSMNFVEGGRWHYAMVSPEGEKHWCVCDYEQISPEQHYQAIDAFADANANINMTMPRTRWNNHFTPDGERTVVNVQITFDKLEDLEALVQMGFKEGFTMGMENLDQYINAQFYLRKQKKPTTNKVRVSTYLNFAGNTEEAFALYKSVFGTDYVRGIQLFSDIPADPSQPPVSEKLQNMVLHVELPITGGHVLMGTDAPEEMGFKVKAGNNMQLNIEPESRAEAQRLFDALSAGGQVSMPLQDMFWGAYFGSFTDKYGINWMINYQQ
ncbi:PhnB protein [Flexibacter flexilis DSM 6793]|uniref:PhnB protein n=1 Tax=Flexibacter flexilis DSM 6793 TaxID=927664 RepID=A0A1I1FXZ6_9BACT|nr:SRPBCC domain-containing protein [Flexibacter flexilis]SFC03902.1 PhnB protein [Flexibacter flexilis DSM 6793]